METRQPSPEALKAAEDFYLKIAAKARAAVEELDLDPSKYGAIFEELLDETSDRAVAITTYAIFDDVLLEIFQNHLNPDIPGSLHSILNPSAFLGTSHNRAKLALALRWIGKEVYHDVDILRNVRNRFAHHVDVKSFQNEPIAGYVSSLEILPLAKTALNTTKKRDQFIFRSIGCFQRFAIEIAVTPYAMKFGVPPRMIMGGRDGSEWPQNLYRLIGVTEKVSDLMIAQEQAERG